MFLYLSSDLQNISVHLSSPALFNNVVRLKCDVKTNHPVKYTWFKDNIALIASKDARQEVLPSGVLRIRDYRISDNGNYSCRAENAFKVITSRGLKVTGQCKLYFYIPLHLAGRICPCVHMECSSIIGAYKTCTFQYVYILVISEIWRFSTFVYKENHCFSNIYFRSSKLIMHSDQRNFEFQKIPTLSVI